MDFRFIPTIHLGNAKNSLTKKIKFSSDSYFVNTEEMKTIGTEY